MEAAAASNVHETRIATRWTDFDPLGHLTHSIVFDYFDEARTQVLRRLVGDFEEWPHVVVHVEADFRREVAHGASDLVVRTWVADMKKVTSLRRYEILRDGSGKRILLAKAATDWAFIHYATGMPKRIPAEVSGAFEIVTDGSSEFGVRCAE